MHACNCERCGKLVMSEVSSICIDCIEDEEREFDRIKEYLNENPFATVFQVSVSLNVSFKSIKRYLRENKLEIIERGNQKNEFLRCLKCGAPIQCGCYCTKCATSVQTNSISEERRLQHSYQSSDSRKSTIVCSRKAV
ncbi:MAG: MerR family transcriptional regulator [Ignavibacteriales bacterium]